MESNSKKNVKHTNKTIVKLYQNKCQIKACNEPINDLTYIQPLNKHYGKNKSNNVLVLCNLHKSMFESGELTIDSYKPYIYHINMKKSKTIHKYTVELLHSLDKASIQYHQNFIWIGMNHYHHLGRLYHIKLNESNPLKGAYVGAVGDKQYFLKVRIPTNKEHDLLSMKKNKVSKKYNLSSKDIDSFRKKYVLTYVMSNQKISYIINCSKFYILESKQIMKLPNRIRRKHIRIARERCKNKSENKRLFKELKQIQNQIEKRKLVSEKTRDLEKRRDIVTSLLSLSNNRNNFTSKKYVPDRVKIRAQHFK